MAHVKLRGITITLLIGSLFVVPAFIARAQTTTVEEQTPAERCTLAQNYLKNIQKPRDLRARVDRLQTYRYIYQRLDAFVIRLEKNGQPQGAELRSKLNKLDTTIESFKNNYETYDQAREAAAGSRDCRNNIAQFQAKLDEARQHRERVHADVIVIQNLLSPEITGQLEVLQQELLASGQTRTENE